MTWPGIKKNGKYLSERQTIRYKYSELYRNPANFERDNHVACGWMPTFIMGAEEDLYIAGAVNGGQNVYGYFRRFLGVCTSLF